MRSIVLEILRDGPPQNQLLSPITRYLALCGEHAATALVLPFEHAQWLARMGGLTYRDSEQTRQAQLADVSACLRAVLETIPGFAAELARCQVGSSAHMDGKHTARSRATVHLRLVFNGNELALLPFELAQAPAGFPAAGQPLSLQTEVPICITREVRRSPVLELSFRRRPKILFAYAHPQGEVPYQAHLLELRRAIEPWIPPTDSCAEGRLAGGSGDKRRADIAEHLTLLPRASINALSRLCATGEYTHVHILAHGVQYRRGDDWRFGLALHDASDPFQMDVVDGERLAVALRPHVTDRSKTLAAPLVVSLAACDAANQGSVVGAGASVAHELHLKGVPLVVASQFPLSKEGSVHLTRLLYEGLLWGRHPLHVLDDLRRQLRALLPKNHDWASLIAYAGLPEDIEKQSEGLALDQARLSIQAAFAAADSAIARALPYGMDYEESDKTPAICKHVVLRDNPVEELLRDPLGKLINARKRLNDLLESASDGADEVHGLLAATNKRLAELTLRAANRLSFRKQLDDERWNGYAGSACEYLRSSLEHYEKSFAYQNSTWALVQIISLRWTLDIENDFESEWQFAELSSKRDLNAKDQSIHPLELWSHSNLSELYLIRALSSAPGPQPGGVEEFQRKSLQHASEVRRLTSRRPHDAQAFVRQVRRYWELFLDIRESVTSQLPTPFLAREDRFKLIEDLSSAAGVLFKRNP